MGVAVLGGLLGIIIAYVKYFKQDNVPETDENITGLTKVLYNKYYVDEALRCDICSLYKRIIKIL
jgi:NADH-quinone oxidoreductase subunit L